MLKKLKGYSARILSAAPTLLFGCLTLVALAHYSPLDRCPNVYNEGPIRHILGRAGAFYADILLQLIGHAAYLIALAPIRWGSLAITGKPLGSRYLRTLALAAATVTSSVFLSKVHIKFARVAGGSLGQILASQVEDYRIFLLLGFVLLLSITYSLQLRISAPARGAIQRLFKTKPNLGKPTSSPPPCQRPQLQPKPTERVQQQGLGSLPSLSLLAQREDELELLPTDEVQENCQKLLRVLSDFGIKGKIIGAKQGPVVTLYEFEPAAGVKASRIIGLADDIARSLGVTSTRISNIPGRRIVGLEIPDHKRVFFGLRALIASSEYQDGDHTLPLILGKTLEGAPAIVDLAKMPHLLIAGTTGSGKSVAINTFILSILYRYLPEECRMIMIDPKMLELSVYDGIPHLLAPVVTDPKKAVAALKWTVAEMERRYKAMALVGVRNIAGYNALCAQKAAGADVGKKVQVGFGADGAPVYETVDASLQKLPLIVLLVDEMADLMLVAGKEIEVSVQRLSQMARASGIHIIMATQRPSVDVITGVIKANFPSRISFKITSKIDSRTIIGEVGAEQLLGCGDMLYCGSSGQVSRFHGPFVSDAEIAAIVQHLKTQSPPSYVPEVTSLEEAEDEGDGELQSEENGDLYQKAVDLVRRDGKASISYVQRRLHVGYNKAASLVEEMEKDGIVSLPDHSGRREVLN